MSGASAIEWTDATWNPIVGCSRVSEGCRHCYAERQAFRLAAMGQKRYAGLTKKVAGEIRWTGEVRLVPAALALPLHWRTPRRVFVNSMSDLFHDKAEDAWIAAVFAVMAVSPKHTFQILTKRPRRMRAWINRAAKNLDKYVVQPALSIEDGPWSEDFAVLLHNYLAGWSRFRNMPDDGNPLDGTVKRWPLPNVWLGTSTEDQPTFDARVPHLGATLAALRFLSVEPQLGEIDYGNAFDDPPDGSPYGPIGWVIVGGESGPGARRFDVAWARATVAHCRRAEVPVFVKQLGAKVHDARLPTFPPWTLPVEPAAWREWSAGGFWSDTDGTGGRGPTLYDRKGGDWSEWPADLRVREFPRVGAKA